jgi:hypothetical protein
MTLRQVDESTGLSPVRRPPLASAATSRIPGVKAFQELRAAICEPIETLQRHAGQYADAFRVRAPNGRQFTYLLGDRAYRKIMSLPPDHAGMGGVIACVPVLGFWIPRSRKDAESLQEIILTTRRLVGTMVTPAKLSAGDFESAVTALTAARTARWGSTVNLTADLPPIIYEAAIRFLVGDELWEELGRQIAQLLREIADVIDIQRIAIAHTPAHYFMREYRATRRLRPLLAAAFEPRFRAAPAIAEINRVQAAHPSLSESDRPWMLMYALWNAIAYTGSYAIWALGDILSHPDVRSRVESGLTAGDSADVLTRCLWETIRVHPLAMVTRKLKRPFDYREGDRCHHVPADSYVGVLVTALTHDPERFADPARYDPDRFLTTSPPLGTIFGRGPFGCVAQEFSRVLLVSVLTTLFQHFDMRLIGPMPRRQSRVHVKYPQRPIPITVRRRDSSEGGTP